MNPVELVNVERGELEAFVASMRGFFGQPMRPEHAHLSQVLDRSTLARVDGVDAGTAAVVDFLLTVPGGARVRMDGVTVVVVSPVFRRRGVLRAMMNRVLDDARQRGVALLGLGATESSIYRRFGYGIASYSGAAEIDTVHAALRVPIPGAGRLRGARLDEALTIWMDVESRQRRVGSVNRKEATWRRTLTTAAEPADGGILQVVVHEDEAGVVDGFINYRQELRWRDEVADGVTHVLELCALNGEAQLALWQHVLQLDLCEHLVMERFWLDDPIQHWLADPRRLRVIPRDDLHLRVVDPVAMLQARRYAREDSLVIEVRDQACRDIAGRYRLEGGLDGAAAAATDAAPDLVLDGPTLGSLTLGDISVSALHQAGLVEELRPGAVRRASSMFGWSPRPHLTYMF